jgi:hypothetical protein
VKQKIFLTTLIFLFIHKLDAQSILINNDTVVFSSPVTLPYWIPTGTSITILDSINSISIVEFTDSASTLNYSRAISVSKRNGPQLVPNGKTWKIEAIGLKYQSSQVGLSNSSNFGTSVTGVTKTINSILPTILTSPLTFSSSGTFDWTVPTGVFNICVEIWGGGGDGGPLGTPSYQANPGMGGGGGGYGYQCFNVIPGTRFSVNVGGAGSTSSLGNLISASGGSAGTQSLVGIGGTSTATFNYSGYSGNGNNGGAVGGWTGTNSGKGGTKPNVYYNAQNWPQFSWVGGTSASKPGGGAAAGGTGADGQIIIYW